MKTNLKLVNLTHRIITKKKDYQRSNPQESNMDNNNHNKAITIEDDNKTEKDISRPEAAHGQLVIHIAIDMHGTMTTEMMMTTNTVGTRRERINQKENSEQEKEFTTQPQN